MKAWFVIPVNPDAWRIGPITVGRNKKSSKLFSRVGGDAKLQAYQSAVKEWLEGHVPLFDEGEPVRITIYVWRWIEAYTTVKAQQAHAHEVDATNLQKAFEDAIQKVLIHNDRDVKDIRTVVVDQTSETIYPKIVLHIERWQGLDRSEIPDYVWEVIDKEEPYKYGEWIG